MTVVSPENTQESAIVQEKVDTNTLQQKVDANLAQPTPETEDPNWRSFREARKRDKEEPPNRFRTCGASGENSHSGPYPPCIGHSPW